MLTALILFTGMVSCRVGLIRVNKLRSEGKNVATKFVLNCIGIGVAAFLSGAFLFVYELIINI